jgi:hypothetical protein
MNTIINFIKENKNGVLIGIVTAVMFLVLMTANGCNLQSFVKVDVPPEVKEVVDIPTGETITLDEAQAVWDDWQFYVESNSMRFQRAVKDAEDRYAVLVQITDLGIGAIGDASNGIPGGALLMSGLGLLTGLFLKRPGEDQRVAKEKEKSYNAGIAIGADLKSTDPPKAA